ncbi:MAG TPA: ATP-dependent helicase HrpB [Tepidisphaeraceae bacterium]|jgi:ATP-dependent helicase HrpB
MSMISLPIDAELPRILDAIRQSRSAVIVAEPGAGKTTRVPPAILKAGILSADAPNLIMLQPRRVAARLAAARIAEEQTWTLGQQVGYQIRFERRITKDTRLRILTEGILTRQLLSDPYLPTIGCVILDEFHERNLHSDLSIAMLRELSQTVRPDLILIVMSATLNAEPVSKFLGGAPILQSPGRTFPLDIQYRDTPPNNIEESVADTVRDCLDQSGNDILVFLPGAAEIARTQSLLQSCGLAATGSGEHGRTVSRDPIDIFPLHGSLSTADQDRALAPGKNRKVILATNIAETSLTIPGIDTVIDSGLQRLPTYDPSRGMDRLELRRISKASATQRAGRAARTAPGRAIRLWSAKQHAALDDFQTPEIHRVDLSTAVLSIYAWGATTARQFDWFEPPSDRHLASAENLLELLGALTLRQLSRAVLSPTDPLKNAPAPQKFQITEQGHQMLSLPVPPRLARLLLAAHAHGLAEPAAMIAAILSEKDISPRRGPTDSLADSDLLTRSDLQTSPHILKTRDQLLRILPSSTSTSREPMSRGNLELRTQNLELKSHPRPAPEHKGIEDTALLKLLLLAFPDRVVRRRQSDPATGLMVGNIGIRLAHESAVRRGEYFLAIDVQSDDRSRKSEALVRIASRIERDWLDELFPQFIQSQRTLTFDESRQKVIQKNQTFYRDLLLSESEDMPTDLQSAGELLAQSLRPRATKFFESDPAAAQWLARLQLLRRAMPEHPWPDLDASALADLLSTAAANHRSVDQLPPALDLLGSTLIYPLDRLFDASAPVAITVPTGNRIQIDYTNPTGPVLAVRLQELFGLPQTPTICSGRVPLVLHLLGPNYRPVQITNDLTSFWKTTYFQVRKDLKARYPKHSWPENPLTAPPQAKGRRKSNS